MPISRCFWKYKILCTEEKFQAKIYQMEAMELLRVAADLCENVNSQENLILHHTTQYN